MGKSTISMAVFNSYVKLPEGKDDWMVQVSIWSMGYSKDFPMQSFRKCAGFPAMVLMTLRSTQDEQLDLGMNGASSSHYHEGDSLWVQQLLQMRDDSPL